MPMGYRNYEGYNDPTAGLAISRVMRESRLSAKERPRKEKELRNRKKVYVVSKYAGDISRNVRNAISACRFVVSKGCMPVASHLLYPQILDDRDAEQRLMGTAFGLSLLDGCDEVWVFTEDNEHTEISTGMQHEIDEAWKQKKPIRYFSLQEINV